MAVGRLIHAAVERARRLSNVDRRYTIGKFNNIKLPADHLLPTYQRRSQLYDRFLPCVAALLPPGTTVVDVGANCGDTLAAMASVNSNVQYICIEPDPGFYGYLVKNIERMRTDDPRVRAIPVRSLIGKDIGPAALRGSGGTKRATTANYSENAYKPTTLDDVVNGFSTSISLLKSDVDGFDFDVLRSGGECILRNKPLIYFECDYENATQLESYHDVVNWLANVGYHHWVAFDNFGGVVLANSTSLNVNQLLDYVWRQKAGRSPRTMFYLDLLSVPASYKSLADRALDNYLGLELD